MVSTDEDGVGDEHEAAHEHFVDVKDGCGCAEIWEELSEYRTGSNVE